MATTVELGQLVDHWQDGASQTLPTYTELTSLGFAQAGDPVSGVMATRPGSAWFNLVAAMRVSVIRAAGMTPSSTPDPLQFLTALQSLAWIKDKTITAAMMADAIITAAKLANSAVETAKIKDAAVTAVKLAAAAVESGKIASGAVTSDKLGANSVTNGKIAANAVVTTNVQDSAITTQKIANGNVSTEKLANDSVTSEKIADGSVTPEKFSTNLSIDDLPASWLDALMPAGEFILVAGTTLPTRTMLCNGAAVSRTTYSRLFAVIGTRYGAGDGSTTFNLPNLNGRVLQGVSDTSQVGTYKEASLPNIQGQLVDLHGGTLFSGSGVFSIGKQGQRENGALTGKWHYGSANFQASSSNAIFSGSSLQPSACLALVAIRF